MEKMTLIAVIGIALSASAHNFDANTIAFYPFRDGAPGTSALTVGVTNLIDAAKYKGTFQKFGTGDVLFSDERPGDYLFTNLSYAAEANYANPGSLYFPNDSTVDNHCTISFKDLAKTSHVKVAFKADAGGAAFSFDLKPGEIRAVEVEKAKIVKAITL